MRIRAVRIDVETEGPSARFELRLDAGLVVISAPNSRGKSLLFQSIVYGLGLEGMYGPGRQHGLLTRALTEEVRLDGQTFVVIASSVTVEIENKQGQILTVRRAVAGSLSDQLVATWPGPALTGSVPDSERVDYFVRRARATTGEYGFHRLLTDFIGWQLPLVPVFNGSAEVPLYPELLFPLVAIEQKSGWSGILPRIPSYLQVREPLQRGIEFFLGFGLVDRARELQRLSDREVSLRREWDVVVAALQTSCAIRGARLAGLPEWSGLRRSAESGLSSTNISATAETLQGSEWVSIDVALDRTTTTLEPVDESTGEESRPDLEALEERLSVATARLRQLSGLLVEVEETLDMVHAQLGSLRSRLSSIGEERRRYEQLRVLVELGSPVAVATFSHRDCPTCQQSLLGLEHAPELATLDYEQSLSLLVQQARALKDLEVDAERSADDQVLVRTQIEREADSLRREIRAIRADLLTPETTPSIAQLQARIQEENHRNDLQILRIELLDAADKLGLVAADLANTITARRRLGAAVLTPAEGGACQPL